MGALGMIKKDTDKHIKKITGRLSQYDIQKTSCFEFSIFIILSSLPNQVSVCPPM